MQFLSVAEVAKKWNISERSVRNYCAHGRVPGAVISGKTWNIPENAQKPERSNKKKELPITLLDILQEEKAHKYAGGIYHKTQIDLTYNSNHMEGSRLTEDQTRSIYETRTIGVNDGYEKIDDIIETVNHFRCFDYILSIADKELSEDIIKHIQLVLKSGTLDSEKEWFAVVDYKKRPNMIGDMIETTHPSKVESEIKKLLKAVIWALNKERLINSGFMI